MANELATTKPTTELSSAIEQVMIQGDLSKLNPQQRVEYYNTVCQSMGLNPYTKPFDYINLSGKLTLYARKDATDQLRRINGVSIDDLQREIVDGLIIVTAKGHDQSGRTDAEIGVVSTKDMNGNIANALMKANTKAKRRLTLSLCGLGWLDETEVETIPNVQPVIVNDSGEIVETPVIEARIDSKAVVVDQPKNDTPKTKKPVEAQEKPEFNEAEYIAGWKHVPAMKPMTLAEACEFKTTKGTLFRDCSVEQLAIMWNIYRKRFTDPEVDESKKKDAEAKMSAINEIMTAVQANPDVLKEMRK